MTIAVIGAGIQGSTASLELSSRGHTIVLFDQAPRPMERASRWNEGKIHLGYLWANDTSMRTARTMIAGATVFHRKLTEYLEEPIPEAERSEQVIYGVHRSSLLGADVVAQHFARVDGSVRDGLRSDGADYLGQRSLPSSRVVPTADTFDPSVIACAIRTPERSVDSRAIADRIVARLAVDTRITFLGRRRIDRIVRRDDGRFEVDDGDGERHGPFRSVVNASWESRLALDSTLGHVPSRPWLHRYKVAVYWRPDRPLAIPSVTLMLGPFGDVVTYRHGEVYLSWYPSGRIGATRALGPPPDAEASLDDARRRSIVDSTVRELAAVVPALRDAHIDPAAVSLHGGHIFAWGALDVSEARSGLHRRDAVGVRSDRGYHSIDTGKYTLAPSHAVTLARRVGGDV